MLFDGTNINTYGLDPISVKGYLDMPGRLDEWYYDWGTDYEILFDPYHFAHRGRNIMVRCLYDPNMKTNPATWDALTRAWLDGQPMALRLTESNGTNGLYTVRMNLMNTVKEYRSDHEIVEFVFKERIATFHGTLPAPTGGSTSLGGFGFGQFGIDVLEVKAIHGIPGLQAGVQTYFLTEPDLEPYRQPQTFQVSCLMTGSSKQDLLVKMDLFHVLLASNTTLTFTHEGLSFQSLCPWGFTVTKQFGNVAIFDVTLIRVP